jgi:hypothetical protein
MSTDKFSLSIGDISGIIQAVGVVVSLVYVAIQAQASTKAIKGATYQSIIAAYADIEARISQDAETARIYRKGCDNPEALVEKEEQLRFRELVCSIFNFYENLHYQYKNKLLDETLWAGWCNYMRLKLEYPGIAKYWEDNGCLYSKDFREYVKSGKCPRR